MIEKPTSYNLQDHTKLCKTLYELIDEVNDLTFVTAELREKRDKDLAKIKTKEAKDREAEILAGRKQKEIAAARKLVEEAEAGVRAEAEAKKKAEEEANARAEALLAAKKLLKEQQ